MSKSVRLGTSRWVGKEKLTKLAGFGSTMGEVVANWLEKQKYNS